MCIRDRLGREHVVRDSLRKTKSLEEYDFVFFDNPPSISLITVNSLVASHCFIVPVSADFLPLTGLQLLSQSFEKVKAVREDFFCLGILLTLYARNERICRQVESVLQKEYAETLFKTKIRVNTKGKSAPSVTQTIFEYENSPKGRGTEDFGSLADEFLERVGNFFEIGNTEKRVANE